MTRRKLLSDSIGLTFLLRSFVPAGLAVLAIVGSPAQAQENNSKTAEKSTLNGVPTATFNPGLTGPNTNVQQPGRTSGQGLGGASSTLGAPGTTVGGPASTPGLPASNSGGVQGAGNTGIGTSGTAAGATGGSMGGGGSAGY